LESILRKGQTENDKYLNELLEQFQTSGIYKNLENLLDSWETELRSRSLLARPSKTHDMVQNLLKKITEIAEDVQEVLEKFRRCGNFMRRWNLFRPDDDCKKLFSNLDKLQVQLFFITCRFVHIGSNVNEEYHNPIVHKPNKVKIIN